MKNERSSKRLASLAGRILSADERGSTRVALYADGRRKGDTFLYWRDIRALAASVLTQAPDKKKKRKKRRARASWVGERMTVR